ncbi:MAG: MATE family efflux transporter, partial [Bacillota bacterium]|nr:MATE family efflux transporter [Bacillota bacterium]
MTPHQTDFAHGDVRKNIIDLTLPLLAAQILNLLYNVVDRIYIARIPEVGTSALTGLGICFPVIAIITAFGNLFSMGGTPLCAMRQGEGRDDEAEQIIGNVFTMLLFTSAFLMAAIYLCKKPLLYRFGASDVTFPYANDYLSIYLLGTFFAVVGLGMNSFINCQGFGRIGMMTVTIGSLANIILDPIFIFALGFGVKGAAIATVISQGISALWVMKFLTSSKAVLRLKVSAMRVRLKRIASIVSLGFSSFVMSVTGSAVQVIANSSLQFYGGDLYVCAMTVLNT